MATCIATGRQTGGVSDEANMAAIPACGIRGNAKEKQQQNLCMPKQDGGLVKLVSDAP